jgi:ABC-type polysaccharide/polyol phosphate export permease
VQSRPAHSWRWLLANFLHREITSRYAGAAGGLAWAIASPLVQLAIFGVMFGMLLRVPENALGGLRFIGFLAIALWPWIMFSEGVQRAVASVPGNAGLIRKVAFPHELLILASVGGSFAIHAVGWLVVLVALSLWGEPIHWAGIVFAVPLLVSQFAFTVGVGALLAALHVVLRDVEQALGLALTALFYATPIVYPPSIVPSPWREWLGWNPLGYVVTRYRDLLGAGAGWQTGDFAILIVSFAVLAGGLWVFRRLSPYFEDLL